MEGDTSLVAWGESGSNLNDGGMIPTNEGSMNSQGYKVGRGRTGLAVVLFLVVMLFLLMVVGYIALLDNEAKLPSVQVERAAPTGDRRVLALKISKDAGLNLTEGVSSVIPGEGGSSGSLVPSGSGIFSPSWWMEPLMNEEGRSSTSLVGRDMNLGGISCVFPHYLRLTGRGMMVGAASEGDCYGLTTAPPDSPLEGESVKGVDTSMYSLLLGAYEPLVKVERTMMDSINCRMTFRGVNGGSISLLLSRGSPWMVAYWERLTPRIEGARMDGSPLNEGDVLKDGGWNTTSSGGASLWTLRVGNDEGRWVLQWNVQLKEMKEGTVLSPGLRGNYGLKISYCPSLSYYLHLTSGSAMAYQSSAEVKVDEEGFTFIREVGWLDGVSRGIVPLPSLVPPVFLDAPPPSEHSYLQPAYGLCELRWDFERVQYPRLRPPPLGTGSLGSSVVSVVLPVWEREVEVLLSLGSLAFLPPLQRCRVVGLMGSMVDVGFILGQEGGVKWKRLLLRTSVEVSSREGYAYRDGTYSGVVSTLKEDYSAHHRRYGHLLYSASVVLHYTRGKERQKWWDLNKNYFTLLSLDVASSRNNSTMPKWRCTDWSMGCTMDGGFNTPPDLGNHRQYPSEAVHCWYGMWLLGVEAGDSEMEEVGLLLYNLDTRAASHYHMLQLGGEIHGQTQYPSKYTTSLTEVADLRSCYVDARGVAPSSFPLEHLPLLATVYYPLTLSHCRMEGNSVVRNEPRSWYDRIGGEGSVGTEAYQSWLKFHGSEGNTRIPVPYEDAEAQICGTSRIQRRKQPQNVPNELPLSLILPSFPLCWDGSARMRDEMTLTLKNMNVNEKYPTTSVSQTLCYLHLLPLHKVDQGNTPPPVTPPVVPPSCNCEGNGNTPPPVPPPSPSRSVSPVETCVKCEYSPNTVNEATSATQSWCQPRSYKWCHIKPRSTLPHWSSVTSPHQFNQCAYPPSTSDE